jgi:hypothetical protein
MNELKPKSDDYITLRTIKSFLLALLSFFFRLLKFSRLVFRKNRLFIIAGLLVGLLLGLLIYSTKPKYFQVSMIVEFNELTKRSYAEILGQLNGLAETETSENLSRELQVPLSIAEKVTSIKSENMSHEDLSKDTSTRTKQPFKIIVGLKERTISDTLQNALLRYLNELPYLRKTKEERIKIQLEKLSYVNTQLAKMDSLKTEYTRFISNAKISATFYNNAFDPADLYKESLILAKEREEITEWLALESNAVRLIDGFKISKVPKSTSMINSMLLYGLIVFVACFLIAFFVTLNQKIKNNF